MGRRQPWAPLMRKPCGPDWINHLVVFLFDENVAPNYQSSPRYSLDSYLVFRCWHSSIIRTKFCGVP